MAKKKAGTRDISEKIIGRLKEQELLQDLVKSKEIRVHRSLRPS